jgi:cytoskeletal protein CcmA (bactofilin family)
MEPKAESVVAEGSLISGKLTGQDVTVLGRFEGELQVKGRLRVGPSANVKATARAASAEINGEFDGEVRADRLSFGDRARARGSFHSDRLSMADGAWVEGSFNPGGAAAPAQPEKSAADKPGDGPKPPDKPGESTKPPDKPGDGPKPPDKPGDTAAAGSSGPATGHGPIKPIATPAAAPADGSKEGKTPPPSGAPRA